MEASSQISISQRGAALIGAIVSAKRDPRTPLISDRISAASHRFQSDSVSFSFLFLFFLPFLFLSFFFCWCSFASQRQRWIFTAATGGHRFRIDPPYWTERKKKATHNTQNNKTEMINGAFFFFFLFFYSGCNGVPWFPQVASSGGCSSWSTRAERL